jgi:hypothetical protein
MARATAAIGAPRVCACCSGSSPFAGLSGFAELRSAPDGIAGCCARGERPCNGRTADKCDKFPSPHGFARAEDTIGYEKNITFLD